CKNAAENMNCGKVMKFAGSKPVLVSAVIRKFSNTSASKVQSNSKYLKRKSLKVVHLNCWNALNARSYSASVTRRESDRVSKKAARAGREISRNFASESK